jgi:ribosome-associated protein
MIEISSSLFIEESALSFEYFKASGPGGQNINKVSTAVRLKFNLKNTTVLSTEQRERLQQLAGKRISENGFLIIEAKRFRTQEQNRLDAIKRLVLMINAALIKPKTRFRTQPSRTARTTRKNEKKRRGKLKINRHQIPIDWEE